MSYNNSSAEAELDAGDVTEWESGDLADLCPWSTYPSCFSEVRIIITAVCVTLLMAFIVVGNLMVVIAIAREKSLKQIQNWFLASLAVADMLIGGLIVPFTLAQELMGYWYFSVIWCEVWKALDVLLCTASTLSLCVISLDRYWSITQAIKYVQKRTPLRVGVMIAVVWIGSAVISVPPLLGWRDEMPAVLYPLCQVSQRIGYVLYSSMGSFFVPMAIMVFVYFRVYLAARKRARKGVHKKKLQPTETTTIDGGGSSLRTVGTRTTNIEDTHAGIGTTPVIYCFEEEDHSQKNGDAKAHHKQETGGQADEVQKEADKDICMQTTQDGKHVGLDVHLSIHKSPLLAKICAQSPLLGRQRTNTSNSEDNPFFSQAERQKRKLARARERRATLVIGLIIAAFILCWLPFGLIYVIQAICDRCTLSPLVFSIFFFLGYCNSALNPVIYTIFNKDFRKAFKKMLGCEKRGTGSVT